MKRLLIIFLSLFMALPSFAAREYSVILVQFNHNPSVGTFTWNNASYGHITGGDYVIKIRDTVTDLACYFSGTIELTSPLTHWPTLPQLTNKIKTNAKNNSIKQYAIDCLESENAKAAITKENVSDSKISGIEKATLVETDLE